MWRLAVVLMLLASPAYARDPDMQALPGGGGGGCEDMLFPDDLVVWPPTPYCGGDGSREAYDQVTGETIRTRCEYFLAVLRALVRDSMGAEFSGPAWRCITEPPLVPLSPPTKYETGTGVRYYDVAGRRVSYPPKTSGVYFKREPGKEPEKIVVVR